QTCALPISYIVFTVFPFYFSLRLRLSRATLGKSPVATLHKESPPKGGELDPRLRGRCPLARFACFPHVRHVAGVHGGRASPYFKIGRASCRERVRSGVGEGTLTEKWTVNTDG